MITDVALDVEAKLLQRSTADLFPSLTPGTLMLPEYDSHSLVNVPATLGELLQARLPGVLPPLGAQYWRALVGDVRRVVVVLLDALGYRQFQEAVAGQPGSFWQHLARRGVLLPMTSLVPSTTSTALASLLTGTEPITHGLLGYELWLREYGVLTEMLALKPAFGTGKETLLDWGLDPERFLPVPGIGSLLAEQGVRTVALVPMAHTHGGLTRMCYRGFTHVLGYTDVDGMCALALDMLRHDLAERSLYVLYWGGIDSTIHRNGSSDGQWLHQFGAASRAIERLLRLLSPRERQGTVFVMLADHGFVDAPEPLAHVSERNPVLQALLTVPYSGEARATYLHTTHGDDPSLARTVQQSLGDHYSVVPMRAAVAAGLFGKGSPAPESAARLGQFFVAAHGEHYLDRRNIRSRLRGRHGGLSPREMLVPWLAVRLDDKPG